MERQQSYYVTDWLDKRAKHSPDRIALHDTLTGRDLTFQVRNTWAWLSRR